MRNTPKVLTLMLVCGLLTFGPSSPSHAQTAKPGNVLLTWMSVTNWLFEAGDTRILTDGYITRIPEQAFSGVGFATAAPAKPDVPAIERLIVGLGTSGKINFILTGHSHFDHSFDTAAWAKLTGARIIGSRSTCLQAVAQGIPSSQCTAVEGGEVLPLGNTFPFGSCGGTIVAMYRRRSGRVLYTPIELTNRPSITSATAGLRPGTYKTSLMAAAHALTCSPPRRWTDRCIWFYSNTGNADTFFSPATVDKEFFQTQGLSLDNLDFATQPTPPQDNLRAALTAAGLDHVGLWIGYSDRRLSEAVCTVPCGRKRIFLTTGTDYSRLFFAAYPFPYATVAGTDAW